MGKFALALARKEKMRNREELVAGYCPPPFPCPM